METSQSWSIIVFCYNEESGIGETIEKTLKALKKMAPSAYEIIIVDDGSTDKTKDIATSLSIKYPEIFLINHNTNMGIGKALLSGYEKARFENVCAIPGDGQFNPEELIPFAYIPENTIISFYRTQKIRYTLFRKLLSFLNRIMNRYFLGIKIKDVNWIKVYKKDFLEKNQNCLTSSLVESEMCAKAFYSNYKIIEVPSKYYSRIGGQSKGASFKIIKQAFLEIFALYFKTQKYRKKK